MAKLAKEAASTLLTPTPTLPAIESESWDWQWQLVGNETDTERTILDNMLSEAKRFVADMATGAEPRWLVIVGKSGTGKTMLADRIRWWVKGRGRAIYEKFDRKRIDPHGDRYESLYTYAQGGALLCKWGRLIEQMRGGDFDRYLAAGSDWFKVIDDLGVDSFDASGNPTKFATQKMAELLDRRLRKWTVITSNFTRTQLATTFDARIASRLMRDGNVIVDASDVRDFFIRREALGRMAA
jgi:hypothetical protein